jgi:hypothetical protein
MDKAAKLELIKRLLQEESIVNDLRAIARRDPFLALAHKVISAGFTEQEFAELINPLHDISDTAKTSALNSYRELERWNYETREEL